MTVPVLLAQSADVEVVSGELRLVAHGETRMLWRSSLKLDDHIDMFVWCRHRNAGTSLADGESRGVIARRRPQGTFVAGRVTRTGLFVTRFDGYVPTDLASVALPAAQTADTNYWIVLRAVGNVLTAEHWLADPEGGGSAAVTLEHTLTGADAVAHGSAAGPIGMFVEQPTTWAAARLDDFVGYRRRQGQYLVSELAVTQSLGHPTPLLTIIRGPAVNPTVTTLSGGLVKLNTTVAAGREVTLHSVTRRAVLDDGTDLTAQIAGGAVWVDLAPTDRIRMYADAYHAAAQVSARYYNPIAA